MKKQVAKRNGPINAEVGVTRRGARPVELPLCERAAKWLAKKAPGAKKIVLGTHLEVKAAVWAKILSENGSPSGTGYDSRLFG